MVSFTTKGITFTFQDSDVNKVVSSISTGIENTEITQSGPMGSYNYDFEGVKKTITLNGQLTEADTSRTSSGTVTTILLQKQWLESLANGEQGNIEFDSTYESQSVLNAQSASFPLLASFTSTKVMVDSINFTENQGEVEQLQFQIVLLVGSP